MKRLLYQIAIASTVGYTALTYGDAEEEEKVEKSGAFSKTPLEVPDKAKDEAQEEEKADEDVVQVPETMPEDAFFIPLGRIHELPPTRYKSGDPEWQSFVEFGQKRERPAAVKKELADMIYSVTGTIGIHRHIGVPAKLGRVWLDILVPPGPPPEYEQSGLEITDDYVAWTTRPISALQVARIKSALKPLPVAKSLWAGGRTYCSLQFAKLKQFLNIAPKSSDTGAQLPVGTITLDEFREKGSKEEAQSRSQMDKMSDPKSDASGTKGSAKSDSSDASKLYGSLPPLSLESNSDMGTAITEFKRTLAKNWQRPSTHGERGTFVVRGDVEVTGPRGSCVLEVVADYHPREARYMTVGLGVKYYLPRRQRPRPLLEKEPKKSSP